jgi:cytochrome P450
MTGITQPALYDPFSFATQEDPFAIYRVMRDAHPVYRNQERDFWALTRFADVQAAARDWRTFSNGQGVELDDMVGIIGAGDLLNLDPPRHDELRKLLRDYFVSRALARLEPAIRASVDRLLTQLAKCRDVDLAADFAWQLPVSMISALMGIPDRDHAMLLAWLRDLELRVDDEIDVPPTVIEAAAQIKAYLFEQIVERRGGPPRDVLGRIAEAWVDGELAEQEVAGLAFILLLAGTDTTASLITNALHVLDRHPEQRARFQRGDVDVHIALDELLRFESPVQNLARTTTEEVELHGQVIPAGARVLLVYGAANRDERRFQDPDRLDFEREPRRHLAFGEGIHFCMGAPLARLEASIALPEFFRRFDSYELTGPAERIRSHATRGFVHLPARVVQAGPSAR